MTGSIAFPVQLLPGMLRVGEAHRQAGQQHDNLCGPYWVALLLRACGLDRIDTEQIASLAGSVLPAEDSATWLPKGALPRQHYRLPLPRTEQIAEAGTSVAGLMEAISLASEGDYTALPFRTQWSEERVKALIALCQDNPDWEAVPICNLRTGHLWGGSLGLSDAIAYLCGHDITPPAADWDVGHFLVLAGIVAGVSRSLVVVQDTYPILGWDGYHLQPLSAIAAALRRDDGHQGGVLLFIAAQQRAEVERQARERGFHIAVWDNGTPKKL